MLEIHGNTVIVSPYYVEHILNLKGILIACSKHLLGRPGFGGQTPSHVGYLEHQLGTLHNYVLELLEILYQMFWLFDM